MAPVASEPRQLLTVLNPARRQALLTLVREITDWMRAQLELRDQESGDAADTTAPRSATASSSSPSGPDASVSQLVTPPSAELVLLRRAALAHLDAWRKDVIAKLREVVATHDDAETLNRRRERAARTAPDPEGHDDGNGNGNGNGDGKPAVDALQALYRPLPTRLATLPVADREEILSCVLLLLLSAGHYTADSRALVLYLTSALGLPLAVLVREETEIAQALVETAAEAERRKGNKMSADAEAQKRREQDQVGRYWKVGLASVAGAAIIGVTGGLAAPVVAGAIGGLMGTIGLGGVASFLGIFWMNSALVATLFGAYGARMTGEMVDQYARHVNDFRFLPLREEQGGDSKQEDKEARRLRVTVGVNGWLNSADDVTKPWWVLGDESEAFALRFEIGSLLALGKSLEGMVSSYVWKVVSAQILKRTVLATLWAALWPAHLLSLASIIDTPFNLALNRSEKAGQILADALINKVQGERPVTLIGYSLGARVIYSCLRTLAERRAFGLVDTAVFIGAPVPSNRLHWQTMRSVVSGKLFNVYSENDYVLAFMYRATSIQLGVAGLQAVRDVEGVENLDLSDEVKGHLRYPDLIGKVLVRCGFPNIKGGEGPIEKEEVEEDGGVGDLADIDKLAIEDTRALGGRAYAGPAGGDEPGHTGTETASAPSVAKRRDRFAGRHAPDDGENSDEQAEDSDGGRIQMISYDSDDDLTYAEPVPM